MPRRDKNRDLPDRLFCTNTTVPLHGDRNLHSGPFQHFSSELGLMALSWKTFPGSIPYRDHKLRLMWNWFGLTGQPGDAVAHHGPDRPGQSLHCPVCFRYGNGQSMQEIAGEHHQEQAYFQPETPLSRNRTSAFFHRGVFSHAWIEFPC